MKQNPLDKILIGIANSVINEIEVFLDDDLELDDASTKLLSSSALETLKNFWY